MGAFIVAIIVLAASVFTFFNALMMGIYIETDSVDLAPKIYINIQYLIATVLLCSAFVLLGISETYRKISKIFLRIENLFTKNKVNANLAIKLLQENMAIEEKKTKVKCPKCNNPISIENNFKDKFYCPHCGVKLSF